MPRKLFVVGGTLSRGVAPSSTTHFPQEKTVTGEIVERACFESRGAHGPDHANCARRCFERGGEMGLLTDDGTLVLLVADGDNPAPFEALKDLAGEAAQVRGDLAEKDGMKIITVTGSKAAS